MYNEYFGFNDSPFSIAPDPRYLYMSEQHREALAHLLYGFGNEGGFVLLTGEVGTGKTTVCRCLLEQVPADSAIAFIFNPKLTVEELLATICDEFGVHYPEGNSSIKVFIDLINNFLLDASSKDQKAVLIIDEAQNLSADVLEQLRLLTNLETDKHKLLQIILLGQPELRDMLSKPELRQLSQRIIARYHIDSLSRKEVGAYVSHRLSVAGGKDDLFPESSIKRLFRLSGGVPRLINVLCDRALLGAYSTEKKEVKKSVISKAAREVFGEEKSKGAGLYSWVLILISVTVISAVLASTYYKKESDQTTAELPAVVTPPAKPVRTIDLEWPLNEPISSSRQAALKELLGLWQISMNPDNESPCDYADKHGLRCLNGIGSLHTLRQLNRPAVLGITDSQGKEYSVTLRSLVDRKAIIIIGSETREVPVNVLGSYWLGSYTILWKVPEDYKGNIVPGNNDPLVRWLDKQLSLIQGMTAGHANNTFFDEALVKRLKKFQLSRNLIPDGIVGAHTIIHINTILDHSIPLLLKEGGPRS